MTGVLRIPILEQGISFGDLLRSTALPLLRMPKFPDFIPWLFWSLGVVSLAFDWGQENCWFVPQVYLVPRVLLHFILLSISWCFWLSHYRSNHYVI